MNKPVQSILEQNLKFDFIIMTPRFLVKSFYRRFLYRPLRLLERFLRMVFFVCFDCFFPNFNAFRFFGIPRGIQSLSGEEIIPAGKELRHPPKTLDTELLPKFSPLEITTPGGNFVILQNGFATSSAAILTSRGRLVPEFTEQFTMSSIHQHKLFTFRLKRCLTHIPHFDATVAPLIVDGQWNYYHWLFDALPKLHLLHLKNITPDFYYADISKPFHKETLNVLNIPEEKTLTVEKYPLLSARSLVVTSFPCKQGIPKWVTEFLRTTFFPIAHSPSKEISNKLFISRREAAYRRILNEEELIPLLKKEGFSIIQPEKLSFAEQVGIFQKAECVVAPHGAGLSNLVFCQPGVKVVELFPPRFPCTCFWTLSNLIGLDYFSVRGEEDPSTYSSECEGYDHIRIDVEKVKKTLDWMLH